MQNAYDQIPYPNLSYMYTHPDHIATIVRLLGLNPPPIERCRVLELGCARGGNLLPMAYTLPESEFVGLDYSARQIQEGLAAVEQLGLRNISLREMNILDVTPELGQFDYIIAHGIYSWTPPEVRDRVLAICKQHLVPNGVAYVSYNTYPGWSVLGVIREAMLYRTRGVEVPEEKVRLAREMLEFLVRSPPPENPYGKILQWYADFLDRELSDLGEMTNAYLLHDALEGINEPVYFYQFVEHAAAHGLQYVVESELRDIFPYDFDPEVRAALPQMAHNPVELEQLMDVLRNQLFRQSLLCHAELPIHRRLDPMRLQSCFIASPSRCETESPALRNATVARFSIPEGDALVTDHPVTKTAMQILSQYWPHAFAFNEILVSARDYLGLPPIPEADPQTVAEDAQRLATNLLQAFVSNSRLVAVHSFCPKLLTAEIPERPVVSPVARYQAQAAPVVTNLWHERVFLNSLRQHLVQRLDGTVSQADLVAELLEQAARGEITIQRAGTPVSAVDELRPLLERQVLGNLHALAGNALLVAAPGGADVG